MPLGVDHEQFSPNGVAPKLNYEIINAKFSNQSFSPQPKGFTFLSVFRWSYRKGPDVLIKAFLDEFKRGDDVSLVIVSRHPMCVQNDSTINSVRSEITKFVTMYGINDDSPPIYWCHDIIPDDIMPSVFNIADCYVSTSRGEGWGLPNVEAGCCEIPVICPNHTGHDYAKDEFVYPIGVDDLEICNNVTEWKPWITKNFFGQKFPVYGHKIVDDVRKHMRRVMDNNTEAKEKAGRFRRFILENYTWEKCIDNVENRVFEVLKGLNK